MKLFLTIITLTLLLSRADFSQDSFTYTRDEKFYKGGSEFYFLGFSAYYLQWMSSDTSKRYIADDVFRLAQHTRVKVIRTWAFNSNQDSTIPSIIRYAPYKLKENGLRALDYVIYKAKQYDVNLILTLENNFSDFGGIEQYIYWADLLLEPQTGKVYNKNDFFTDDSIKRWYKFYVSSILNRRNVYNGVKYKDEPIIFSFELINEASNMGISTDFIKDWYREMAVYFKSIDSNHLLTTGEVGYDIHSENYSDPEYFYNNSHYPFNGYEGTSFTDNTAIEDIDYSSFHLYPDAWGFEPLAGNTWISDHVNITNGFNKPALLGEFGVINEKYNNYKIYFETIRKTPSRSTVIWDYVHPDLMNISDSYAFNEVQDPDLFKLFKEHIRHLEQDTLISIDKEIVLDQNYPNPFNPATTIQYTLRQDEFIKIELFNSLGELVKVIAQGFKPAGTYRVFLSFNNTLLASGVYFYRLSAIPLNGNQEHYMETRKMILLK